jgi:hypothetical protein
MSAPVSITRHHTCVLVRQQPCLDHAAYESSRAAMRSPRKWVFKQPAGSATPFIDGVFKARLTDQNTRVVPWCRVIETGADMSLR